VIVDRKTFEGLVADAIDLVPESFAEALDEVGIVVRERAPAGMGSVYGLYQGVPRDRPDGSGWGELPAIISIYMWPLMSHCRDEAELVEQVRITVLHELGHHLGMDEDDLDRLGYG
jgi:predicted Zn-dependent protease with MMP-like domain